MHDEIVSKARRKQEMHELQALGLEGNNFTEAGVLEIAAALTSHMFMQELSLAHQRQLNAALPGPGGREQNALVAFAPVVAVAAAGMQLHFGHRRAGLPCSGGPGGEPPC